MHGKVIYFDGSYKILERRRDFVLINVKASYECHGHFDDEDGCHKLIKLMKKNQIPKGEYMREAALRISTDEQYIQRILHKIEKDRNKQKFYKPQKGVRK